MAKDPIFPLYYNDIDRSTKTWTDEEFGAYMRLLMEQWDKGSLPKDYQRLTRIATSLDKNWPLLKDKFVDHDGVLKNVVLEEIREKRNKHKEKQKENVSKRYQKSTKQPTKIVPLEDEIENEDEVVINNKKELSKIEIMEGVLNDQIFIEGIQQAHKGKDLKQAFNECYIHHSNAPNPPNEIWLWKQKFNTWLTIKRPEVNGKKSGITAQGTLDRLNSYT